MSIKRRRITRTDLELVEHPDHSKLGWIALHPDVDDEHRAGLRQYARYAGSGLRVTYERRGPGRYETLY